MAPAISAATQCTSPMMQDNQESPQKLTQPGTGTIPVHTQSLGQVPRVAQSNPPQILQSPGHPDQRGSITWCLLVTAGIS